MKALRLAAVPAAALLVAVLAVSAALRAERTPSAANEQLDGGPFRGSEPPAPIRLPGFALRDWTQELTR